MDMQVEDFIAQLAAMHVVQPADMQAREIATALGGDVQALTTGGWAVAFSQGTFASALVKDEISEETPDVRITFTVRGKPLPLTTLSAEPNEWLSGAIMPDSERTPLTRNWFNLPSGISVSCSVLAENNATPAETPVGGVSCLVQKIDLPDTQPTAMTAPAASVGTGTAAPAIIPVTKAAPL